MSDPIRRALRTLFQFIAGGGLAALANELVLSVDDGRLQAAVAAFFVLLVSYAQNELEDRTNFPALLKAPASEGENPTPDPGA